MMMTGRILSLATANTATRESRPMVGFLVSFSVAVVPLTVDLVKEMSLSR